jgi:hypothetical protein
MATGYTNIRYSESERPNIALVEEFESTHNGETFEDRLTNGINHCRRLKGVKYLSHYRNFLLSQILVVTSILFVSIIVLVWILTRKGAGKCRHISFHPCGSASGKGSKGVVRNSNGLVVNCFT